MLAKDLINRIERLGLLDQDILEALRQQLDQGGSRVTPEAVAKLLVDNGQLTSFQASKLIGELRSDQYADPEPAEEADLIAGLDDDVAEVVEVAQADPMEVEAVPVSAVAAEAVPANADNPRPMPNRPQSSRKKPPPNKSIWDSFKIYGYLSIIALLLFTGFGLYWWLNKETSDAFIGNANDAYDQQNYQAAQDSYANFLEEFGPDDEYSSIARVRYVMTKLYKAAAFKQEPGQAVDLAKEELPKIANEKGMNQERGNLAALLVDIASNLAKAAGKANETSDKEALLAKLDEHRLLMDDPLYMPGTMRVTLAGQIKGVEEARERVKRDISRNRRLDAAEASMKESLDKKETKQAYDTRKELLRDFPELQDNQRLKKLVQVASDIQETLVASSNKLPDTKTSAAESAAMKSIVLASLSGGSAPDLRGETLYVRAGGSIMAFDGLDGAMKWRKFVGFAKNLDPIRLDDGQGVLLNDSKSLEVLRCDADSGDVVWRSQIAEPFNEPVAAKRNIYVTTKSGRLLSINSNSGKPNWAAQFPQRLETAPGVDTKRQRLYLPGNHSNLYLLNARDGSSIESFYIEHAEGTISVPPIPLFGHVFVIENTGTDYANIHVLRVDEKGEKLRVAQDPIRLAGNVRVQPVIQGRRLIVLTDLGEVKVLDIEISAEGEQVSVVASLPPFYDQPTATQMAVGGSAMWITGTRVGRYELQIHVGQVIRDWSLHELDQCIGKPFISDDALVYARVLRGTSAIRVTAAIPKTGEEIWKTDVGVPVATIRPAEGAVHAITNQAVLYELDRNAIASGSTKGPIENAGSRNVAARFTKAIEMEKGRLAFLDEGGGETVLVYDPNRKKEKLRQIPMRLTAGRPSGGMVFSGGGLFLPLTSGRAVLINWQTGAVKSTPFQPASDPVGIVNWTTPVVLPDDPDQVVVADDRNKIYRLRVSEQIRELASKDLEKAFLGPAVTIDDTYVATMAGPAADFIVGHDLMSLNQSFQTLLTGRVTWGPVAMDGYACVQTDDGYLRAFKSNGKEAFSLELPPGKPSGELLKVGDDWVLAGTPGWFVTIDPSSGSIVGRDDLGQPISATPMSASKSSKLLLIPGTEGVIYVNPTPGS